MTDDTRRKMLIIGGFFLAFVLLLLLESCKTVYVPVPGDTKTEYVYKESKDTTFVRDSVYIKETVKGDTVRIVEYRDRYKFRYITTTDTLVVSDTVRVSVPVEITKIDHQQTWFQKTFMGFGLFCFILLIGFIVLKLRGWKIRS